MTNGLKIRVTGFSNKLGTHQAILEVEIYARGSLVEKLPSQGISKKDSLSVQIPESWLSERWGGFIEEA